MEPTFIGLIQVAIGMILLLVGSIPAMFVFLLASGLFGGSAAMTLPALGGSSIPPIHFALVFLVIRILLPAPAMIPRIRVAINANMLLLAFVAYGLLMAYLGPRMFAGDIDLTPLRGRVQARYTNITAYIYATKPLAPSSQNITTSVYMLGTLLIAISAYVACSYPRSRDLLVKTATCIGWIHVVLGIGGIFSRGTPIEIVYDALRNGAYAQIDNSYRSFVRINGIWPEASSYATYGFAWFVFLSETWLRGIRPKWTGPAALALAITLVFSTSTTAYFGLSIYAGILMSRMLLMPRTFAGSRFITIGILGLGFVLAAMAAMVIVPAFAAAFTDLISHMTVEKGGSLSGVQRSFWAKQGIDAFVYTRGIGVGPGSFRSSSILTAILGCMGVIGIVTFVGVVLDVWKPWRLSTYSGRVDENTAVGTAASWALVSLVLIQCISSPSPDPGPDFGIFVGVSLALRRIGQSATKKSIEGKNLFPINDFMVSKKLPRSRGR